MAAAPTLQPKFSPLGKSKLLAVDEVQTSLPLGEPVTSQGRWGPLAVDELIQAFPLGKGDRLRWMRDSY